MDYLTHHFCWDSVMKTGELELVQSGVKVSCELVLLDECQQTLSEHYFSASH